MKTKTWIKRGGIAQIWVQPTELTDFEKLVIWCQISKVGIEVIGNTSNCYFLNDYNPDLVISTLKLNRIKESDNTIECECGYNMSRLSRYCIMQGYAGYEGFIGLPGTVGGAVINNSGCYGSLTANVILEVTILKEGKRVRLCKDELKYSHRTSVLKSKKNDGIVLSATFNISNKSDVTEMQRKAKEFQIHRKNCQEQTYPNLGTTFSTIVWKKTLPLRFLYPIFWRGINLLIKNQPKQRKAKTSTLLILLNVKKFKRYISAFGIQCFVWKDEKADKLFTHYVNFVKKNSERAILEIDVKQETNY